VDWILPEETNRLIEVTRELGFTEIGQTMECLLGMATYRPLFELTNSLGFKDCRKTIEWLLSEAQQNIAAMNKADFPPAVLGPLPSAQFATHSTSPINIPPQFPLNQVGDTVSSSYPGAVIYNNRPPTEPLNLADLKPLQSLMHRSFRNHDVPDRMMFGNPQQNEFQTNGRGLQGGPRHAENKFSHWMVGQEVSMQQSSQARNNSVQGSNSNHIHQYVDVNSHIQMPYPAQGGHLKMHNMIMEDWYLGNQLQPQFPTEAGGNPSSISR
jgi:hypothetical protein